MTPSNEALRYAYEKFLGIEAPLDLDIGSISTKVEDKFLRRPDYLDITDKEREDVAKGIVGIIIGMAVQYDKDYESAFGGRV